MLYWLADRWGIADAEGLKVEMTVWQLEKWKAHFRARRELKCEEWNPVPDRQMTIEEVMEQAMETVASLGQLGER